MSGRPLPRSTPSAQGVDAAGVTAFLDALGVAREVEMHSVVLARHGAVVAEGWWAPYTPERVHLLYSLSKSFTSAALGLAVGEGLVALDDRVSQHLPVPEDAVHDPTLRQLVTMASGHTEETWDAVMAGLWGDDGRALRDPVAAFLRLPPDGVPGTTFAYNQSCTYTVAAVLQRVTGVALSDYLRPRLLDPLGIGEVSWLRLADREIGFSGLHARTEDVARLGLLHLQEGRWGERQLLAPEWVAEAVRPHVETHQDGKPDWSQGYGFQFWNARHGYRGDGAYGQYCVVLPEHDAVLAATGNSPDMQAVLDAAWEHLLPALDRGGSETADAELAARLRGLALPTVDGAASPDDPAAWDGVRYAVAPGPATPRGLASVTVDRSGGWRLRFDEDGAAVTAALGTADWAVTEDASSAAPVAVATSGAWQPDGSLEAAVLPLEWPHGVRVRIDPGAGAAEVRWTTEPLHHGALSLAASPGPG